MLPPADSARSLRRDLAPLFGLIGLAGTLGVVALLLRPDRFFSLHWLFSEAGNPLYRADQLLRGKLLYRDVACQYGPLPVYLFAVAGRVIGNGIWCSHLYHLVGSLFCLGLLYAVLRRCLCPADALAVAVLFGMPTLLAPGGLIGASTHVEYLPIERLLLLGVMLIWEPPRARSWTTNLLIGVMLGLLQWTKFGSGLVGLCALASVDALSQSRARRDAGSSQLPLPRGRGEGQHRASGQWLAQIVGSGGAYRACVSFAFVLAAFVAVEALRWGLALALLPRAIAWDTIFPAYMLADYAGQRRLPGWSTPAFFVGRQWLGLSGLFVSLYALIGYWRHGQPTNPTAKISAEGQAGAGGAQSDLAAGMFFGPCFFLWGLLGYLGHEHLLYQYVWLFTPAVGWWYGGLGRARPVAALAWSPAFLALVLAMFPPAAVKNLDPVPLPGGEKLWTDPQTAASTGALLLHLRAGARSPDGIVLTLLGWGGGGLHYYCGSGTPLRNPFPGTASWRPYDEVELRTRIDQVDRILLPVGAHPTSPTPAQRLAAAFGPSLAEELTQRLELVPLADVPDWHLWERAKVEW